MADYSALVDLAMTADGDLEIDDFGDLSVHYGSEVIADDVLIRVNTNQSEMYYHQWLGASLEDLVGSPNTQKTGELGRERIISSILQDSNVYASDLDVFTMPFSESQIVYYITISDSDEDIVIPIALNISK